MSREKEIISLINAQMPTSPLRASACFEADAEAILLDDKVYLFTTDDFSAEDLLGESDPFTLGWNLACASISDIVVSGGNPLTYAHSMALPGAWSADYIRKLSQGIAAVLKRHAVSFIGGDLGVSANWRYTASVIGSPITTPVTRKGAKAGDLVYITGDVGRGNLAAAMNLYPEAQEADQSAVPIKFRCLSKLPALVSRFATSAIDTSDGVLCGLKTVAEINKTGFAISDIPYNTAGLLAAEVLGIPSTLLLAGECGEYEILLTVNSLRQSELKQYAEDSGIEIHEIGKIVSDAKCQRLIEGETEYDVLGYHLRARDFAVVTDYLRQMTEWFNANGKRHA
ncbi:MAG: thiamine-monophosphate kinase [Candidatus Cloacimonetes bacterium]|nr:thiamine-monophosphate kinase [Candidatus Cloacimonadota bacterium]